MIALRYRAACFALAAVLLWAAPIAAQFPPAEDAQDDVAEAIRAVIRAQLAAFRRDDARAAFSYAAPSIQQMFGTPERFMTMVRQGYHPVYRPRQVIFQALLVHQERWVQPLLVTAEDGAVLIALYTMEHQPDATWRISGVVLVPSAAQGA